MAFAQRLEIADHEALLSTFDQEGYAFGSLMGGRAEKPRKKPVLVLDADELNKAHLAMAMGGAQLLEEADTMLANRQRVPSAVLGLAPIDADENWEPPVPVCSPREPDTTDEEGWQAPDPFEAGAWQDELASAELPPSLPARDRLAVPSATGQPAASLPVGGMPGLPASGLAGLRNVPGGEGMEDDWDRPTVSISEQLEQMRRLTRARTLPQAPAAPAVPDAAPSVALVPVSSVPAAAPSANLSAAVREEPAQEAAIQPPAAPAPSAKPEAGHLPEAASPVQAVPLPTAAASAEPDQAWEDNGPDLAWMHPRERRALQIDAGRHSTLRARLVQQAPCEPSAPPSPSPWRRFRAWLERLL
ncbi:MAG: hypothetical protein N2Z59_02045 [Alteraurantiacibacter sp.]|nr:hypothetical protein [Alteraurantiacibacter sp.]